MSLPFCAIAVLVLTPATAFSRELPAMVGPALRLAAGMNESSSLLLLGSVLAGLAYIIDGRQGRS